MPIEPQVFDVLLMLVEHRHRVVTKDELVSTVWRGRVVSDSAIASRVKSARQAIGDDGRAQRWIKTVHGLGFRFVGDVATSTASVPRVVSAAEAASPVSPPDPAGPGAARPGVVVMPFSAAGEDVDPVFALGLAHDITTSLSRLRWLRVTARATAFQLVEEAGDTPLLQSRLGVRYRVAGSAYRRGGVVELHVQLDDLESQGVIWADRIEFGDGDLHEVRHSLVCRVAGSIEAEIGAQEARGTLLRSTDSLNAWESYHRAMMHYYCFTASDNRIALALFEQAVSIDPSFARAHAGLSSAAFQNAFNRYEGVDRNRAIEQAALHAEKSIQLDRLDPMANFVTGRVHWLSGQPGESLPWLERALALNPSFAQGYYAHGLASLLSDDALRGYADSSQAIELSPLDPFLYGFYGVLAFSYLADEDVENANSWAEKAASQPEALVVMDLLAAATCELSGRTTRAREWLRRARARNPSIGSVHFFAALPFARGGVRDRLTRAFAALNLGPA